MGDLTSMPADVLRSIWNYLSLPDVIRIGMTAKNMAGRTWPYCQKISMARIWPLDAIYFVLAQDLSHIHSLELCYRSRTDIEDISLLIRQLESLKHSKLSNLRSLSVDLESADEFAQKLAYSIKELISHNTQLQSLSWKTTDVEDFNIGQFFIAHTRLTRLTMQTEQKLIGLHMLTQTKDLDLSYCYNIDDNELSDVMTLTQLQCLNFDNHCVPTDLSFTKITNLTNIEILKMKHNVGIRSTSFNLLSCLPRLTDFVITYPWEYDETEVWLAASIGRLSQLTKLRIHSSNGKLDLNCLTSLTNLMELEVDANMESADFSIFTKLTSLAIRSLDNGRTTLLVPPYLEELQLPLFGDCTEENMKTICSLSKLRLIRFTANTFHATLMARWITQLTRLSELIIPNLPKDLLPALQQLPNLASLTFGSIPNDDNIIEELAKLTQLMELTYWSGYQKDLKTKLPFRVSFIGDLDEFVLEEEDYIEGEYEGEEEHAIEEDDA